MIGLYFLVRYCNQRRRDRRDMMNRAEEAWQKQHTGGAWSIDSSQLECAETQRLPAYYQSGYVAVRSTSQQHADYAAVSTSQHADYATVSTSQHTDTSEHKPQRSVASQHGDDSELTTRVASEHTKAQPSDGFLSHYVAAQRPDSPTLPLHHSRSVSMPPPRPHRPDDMISPLTPDYSGEQYQPYHSLPSRFPTYRPEVRPRRLDDIISPLSYSLTAKSEVRPPPESHPLPQPPYDSAIDLWYQPPTPPPKSDRRVSRIRSIVRKPVPIHFLLSGPKYGGLGGLSDLRRSDTGYSSHYSDASNLERADSVASMGRHTWAPQSAAAYSEISSSTPFDKNEGLGRNLTRREQLSHVAVKHDGAYSKDEGLERKLSRRDFMSARLSNVAAKHEVSSSKNEALERNLTRRDFMRARLSNVVEDASLLKYDGNAEVPDLESDTSDTTSDADSSERRESRENTPDPIPAPLRIIKKSYENEVPVLKFPMPMSFEERREMGRIYAVDPVSPVMLARHPSEWAVSATPVSIVLSSTFRVIPVIAASRRRSGAVELVDVRPLPGVRPRNLRAVTAVPPRLGSPDGAAARGVGAGARHEFAICVTLLDSGLGEWGWATLFPVGDWSGVGFGVGHGDSEDAGAQGDEGDKCGEFELHIGGSLAINTKAAIAPPTAPGEL
ncbi:hypothetical protein V493_07175 [Pseudogymnoascus sp. VKM F-4281 (FW-2241)]|nr:hypothetical protein V493_07175 [Pseudogymnoascus sp. VKM F-4281 (FW-2241)]